jgi:hypothetical protein
LLSAILKEKRIEFFSEWGHRWLDLKRTGTVNVVMTVAVAQKGGTWSSFKQLYPIPAYELSTNNNIVQNPGY